MSIKTQKVRWPLSLVLAGFLASISALSFGDAATDWTAKGCAASTCHGSNPASPSPVLIDLSDDTLASLEASINDRMPRLPEGVPGDCTGTCASDLAAYLFSFANQPPVAITTGSSNLTGSIPLTSNFNGSGSTDDKGIVSYVWNFGDGTAGSGATVSHTYSTVGTYNATLTVTDTDGVTNTSAPVVVQANPVGAPPIAVIHELGFIEDQIPVGLGFNPGDSTCSETPCTYDWDMGDGTTRSSTGFQVGHTFETAGTYTIVLTVTDRLGRTDTDSMTVVVLVAETIAEYVDDCKAELNFDDDDIPDDLNCATGHLFDKGPSPINDFVDYRRVTDEVDLVFACRWVQNGGAGSETFEPPFYFAESIEMIIHNRENGKTCFFKGEGKDITNPDDGEVRQGVPVKLVSPTVAANALPGTHEAEYWANPITLKRELPCVDCHIAGPYIVTPRIAPFMARFGLINDGHDTFGRAFDDLGGTEGKYFSVGSTLGEFNETLAMNNDQTDTCGNSACHSLGSFGAAGDIQRGFRGAKSGFQLLPGIQLVINGANPLTSVSAAGVMPPHDPILGSPDTNDYTWVNRDTPYTSANDSDIETFAEAKNEYETLLSYCGTPGLITAHVVDSPLQFHPFALPDKFEAFNARDGLVCLNANQDDGQCEDYTITYQCTGSEGTEFWTDDYDMDSPADWWGDTGDHENRHTHQNVCDTPPGSTETFKVSGIQASFTSSVNGWTYSSYGPLDRLAKFDPQGLICHNNDQPDGQCSNYVVKFSSCTDTPASYTAKVRSAWSSRLLTDSDSGINAEAKAQPQNSGWDTQDWVIEAVAGTAYVRLKNVGSGLYLNVKDNVEHSVVVAYSYQEDWGSQQWIMEPVSGSGEVRFKNVWTGRYLTVNNNGDYAAILAQTLNNSWPSQRWLVY